MTTDEKLREALDALRQAESDRQELAQHLASLHRVIAATTGAGGGPVPYGPGAYQYVRTEQVLEVRGKLHKDKGLSADDADERR